MAKVIATITKWVDGYITGPDDRAGQGLGVGGERCTMGHGLPLDLRVPA